MRGIHDVSEHGLARSESPAIGTRRRHGSRTRRATVIIVLLIVLILRFNVATWMWVQTRALVHYSTTTHLARLRLRLQPCGEHELVYRLLRGALV